jgi:GNAT superfamily N-acetyltransferase
MLPQMRLRIAVDDDISSMHRVRLSVRENQLSDPNRVQPVHYHAVLRSGRGWVCEVDGAIVAFAIADLASCSVWALFVEPRYERLGIGRQLHDAMIEWLFASGALRISLTTDPHTRAEHFYEAAGWRRVGQEANGEVRYHLVRDRFAKR